MAEPVCGDDSLGRKLELDLRKATAAFRAAVGKLGMFRPGAAQRPSNSALEM
jgi:hypothetical protein